MGYAARAVGETVRVPVRVPGSGPDPDALEELSDEIVALAAHVHAATHRLLVLLAEFDRLRGWESGGHRTCSEWLSFRTGLDRGAAREHVRVARALERLPLIGACMARGELSFSQVRALSRVAEPDDEAELLELVRDCTTAQLERVVRAWRRGGRQDDAARERERHRARTLSVFPDDDGMYVVRGRLEPEVGALLMRAIEAASDALFRERSVPGRTSRDSEREAAQRRADAVGLLAERALAARFGADAVRGSVHEETAEEAAQEAAPAGAIPALPAAAPGYGRRSRQAAETPISGSRAERYQVVLHVDAETLSADGETGRSELEDGTRVSAETSRRLACDAGSVRVVHARDGSILDVGRRTRSIPPALRRALEARDRGCRFPGCGLRFCDAHHVLHWADGGGTSLSNTLLLCRFHHRLVHEGGWRVHGWAGGRAVFLDPRGGEHFDGSWSPPPLRARERRAILRRITDRAS